MPPKEQSKEPKKEATNQSIKEIKERQDTNKKPTLTSQKGVSKDTKDSAERQPQKDQKEQKDSKGKDSKTNQNLSKEKKSDSQKEVKTSEVNKEKNSKAEKPPLKAEDPKKIENVLVNSGILESYEYLLKSLCKHGLPKGNIYEFAAQSVLKFERKLKKVQADTAIKTRIMQNSQPEKKPISTERVVEKGKAESKERKSLAQKSK